MATTDEQEIKVDILVLQWMLLLWDLHHVCRGLVKGLLVVLHVIKFAALLPLTETCPR